MPIADSSSRQVTLAVPEPDLSDGENGTLADGKNIGRRVKLRTPDGRILEVPSGLDSLDEFRSPVDFLTWGETLVHAIVQAVRSFSQQWITHVLLVLLLFGYTAIGGLIFEYVEAPHERRVQRNIDISRLNLSHALWLFGREGVDETVWHEHFNAVIREYEGELRSAFTAGVDPNYRAWTYIGALFFSSTIYTTVGYGNVVPSTDTGRALTMVYACVGIPLLLTVLADLGKVFTRGIKYMWSFVRRFYYTGQCRRVRSVIPIKLLNASDSSDEEPPPFVLDETFDLPVTVALVLLFAYILIGALMIKQWEEQWEYFHAVYFVFVSLTTIGFGDLVPQHPAYLMATFIYLLFGLALTSMCINVVQESLSNTFSAATTKLSVRIGRLSSSSIRRGITEAELAPVHLKTKDE